MTKLWVMLGVVLYVDEYVALYVVSERVQLIGVHLVKLVVP